MPIPPLGLGTFRLKGQAVIDSLRSGLELGYRHIDTAQIYGNEADVGHAIAESGIARRDLFVTTKIWTENLSRERLLPSLADSLEKLRLDAVDLTLIHWPSPDDAVPLAESLDALLDAKRQGLTRAIGVSNFPIATLKHAIALVGAAELATNQVEIHPFLQNRKLIAFSRQHDIHLTAYMPLAYGKVMHDPVIGAIAKNHDATPAQIALAWLLQQGFAVIPSSTKREHQASNLAAAKLRLTREECDAIAALDRNERIANPDFAPRWD